MADALRYEVEATLPQLVIVPCYDTLKQVS
jgi:hypothetical protein